MAQFKLTAENSAQIANTLKKIASTDRAASQAASDEFVAAADVAIREVLLSGDITQGIFTPGDWTSQGQPTYLLDLLTPGQEVNFYAYAMPNHGYIPHRFVETDYLKVPTYRIANSIDCLLSLIRDANMPVVQRMMQILEAGFVKKMNDDAWQTVIGAAADRNILINDPNATAGQFTPRLVALMKTFMRRNGGGNSATLNRKILTDLYVSPEAKDDIRAWNLDLVPDAVRANIFYSSDTGTELMKVYDVNIHDMDEFGESQEYQLYFTSTLGASLAASDLELVVGLNLSDKANTFVRPIREQIKTFEDNTKHREGTFSLYGFGDVGTACLDSRATILGSF